jgi:hypothetical protein
VRSTRTSRANGAVLSISPEFQNAQPDAIYGPRATQEIRWHGHNPDDLAANLRGLDLQVRTANGVPDPGIGEDPTSADTASCVIEGGVHMASVDLHNRLDALQIPHLWHDYGPGCHTKANFERELSDTFAQFAKVFLHPPAAPSTFDYESIEPSFDVWGWTAKTDPKRAVEWLQLKGAGRGGLTLTGTGRTTVTTPAWFRGRRHVALRGAQEHSVAPDGKGRIRFTVDLGPADTEQEDTPGAPTARITRTVRFLSHDVARKPTGRHDRKTRR